MRKWIFSTRFIFLFIITASMVLGCNMPDQANGIYVWIDVPLNGLTIPVEQEINIEGHASTQSSLSKIELWVDGEIYQIFENPPLQGNLTQFASVWLPPGPGDFNIQTIAYSEDGEASQPDNALVHVLGTIIDPSPTPVVTEVPPTEVITPTPVPSETPVVLEPVIEFWADPTTISAGFCSTIYWHVENVASVIFGNKEQAFDGSYQDCMCSSQSFPLTVNLNDGGQDIRYVTIEVTGTCATPTTPPDLTAPPAPAPGSPHNGADLSCTSFVDLIWSAVSDPSGIGQYQVEVQRHSGDNNWTATSGSPLTGIGGTSKNISVECGWNYRWRVRAIDGVGNVGAWSTWFTFNDLLS